MVLIEEIGEEERIKMAPQSDSPTREALLLLQSAWDNIVDMQQGEGQKKLTDVHLICADGLVPAHTCILANVSPVLREAFISQGVDYFGVRSVLLPEHPVAEIERMIQLIYYGSVDVTSEVDVNKLKHVLQEFQISNIDKLKMEAEEWSEFESTHVLYYVYRPDLVAKSKSKEKDATSDKSQAGTSSDTGVSSATPVSAPPIALNPSGTSNESKLVEPKINKGNESDDDIIEIEVININKTPVVIEPIIIVPDTDDVEMSKAPKSETPAVPDVHAITEIVPVKVSGDENSQVKSDFEAEDAESVSKDDVTSKPLTASSKQTKAGGTKQTGSGNGDKKAGRAKADRREESPSCNAPLKKSSRSSSPESGSTTKSTRSSSTNISPTSNHQNSRSTRSGSLNSSSPVKPNLPANKEVNEKTKEPEGKTLRSTRKSAPVTGNVLSPAAKESADSGKKPISPQKSTKPVRELRSRENRKRVIVSSDEEIVSDDPNYNYDSDATGRKNSRQARKKPANAASPIPKPGRNQSPSISKTQVRPTHSTADSDSELDDLEPEFYKDSKRIFHEAKLCRGCNTLYSNPREASDCITEKHKLVRCYFCFNVFKNTEKLFEHYASRHRKAGRENNIICPYCQGTVAHRSISTHVISNHIFDAASAASAGTGPVAGQANAGRGSTSKGKSGIRGMHLVREERPGQNATSEPEEDDDLANGLVMKKKSNDGNVRVFVLDKDNSKK